MPVRPRALSITQVLAGSAVPPAPNLNNRCTLDAVRRSCALARVGDVINLWWCRPQVPAESGNGDGVSAASPVNCELVVMQAAPCEVFHWHGAVEATNADGLHVRWPGAMRHGPLTSGVYDFPSGEFLEGHALVVGMRLVRNQAEQPPLRMSRPTTTSRHPTGAPPVQGRVNDQETAGQQFSFAMVPVIAAAVDHFPEATVLARWDDIRNKIGPELFDDMADTLAEAGASEIQLEWLGDYITELEQNAIFD